ncbi:MAG TPA: hypothetical protein PK402_10690, partial [Tepidisphaeraceae bacterium]|nr:hypothetical protein [Tepidisphaeraceae bacterium]
MSLLPIRSTTVLSSPANVVFVRPTISFLDIRFGPSRVRMESLESRRLLNAGGILDFNGIALPEFQSNWATIVPLDESGSSIEATAEDGSIVQLDLFAFEDGSQVYDFSMATIDPDVTIDPEILYMTGDDSTDFSPEAPMEQAEGSPTLDLADVSEAYPVLSLSIDADGVVSAAGVSGITSSADGSIYLDDLMLPAHVVLQADGTMALAPDYAPALIFYTMDGSDGEPGVDTGEMFESVRDVALADFNNWGVTEITVDDNGVVTAIADGESRTVTLADGDRGAILIDGNNTGYELQQGREN